MSLPYPYQVGGATGLSVNSAHSEMQEYLLIYPCPTPVGRHHRLASHERALGDATIYPYLPLPPYQLGVTTGLPAASAHASAPEASAASPAATKCVHDAIHNCDAANPGGSPGKPRKPSRNPKEMWARRDI
jgi:hypothetical protein